MQQIHLHFTPLSRGVFKKVPRNIMASRDLWKVRGACLKFREYKTWDRGISGNNIFLNHKRRDPTPSRQENLLSFLRRSKTSGREGWRGTSRRRKGWPRWAFPEVYPRVRRDLPRSSSGLATPVECWSPQSLTDRTEGLGSSGRRSQWAGGWRPGGSRGRVPSPS